MATHRTKLPALLDARKSHRCGRRHSALTASGIQSLLVCLFAVVSSLDVCAQSASTGALTGTITDPAGAVLQSAQITLRNNGTGETRIAITDQDGSYRLSLLSPGHYELTVEAVGFAPLVVREVSIRITEVTNLATQLAIKGVQQDVVVEAPLLQTDTVALGRVIARDTIETLPLVNRNFTQILGLTGGTNTDVVDATLLGAGSQEIRANGARSSDNNFMLNGVDANSFGGNMTEATNNSGGGLAIPAPDTIEEFKVQNSLYDAQYGRGGGANVLVETRSGTSQFHGNAYYFGRDEALNANNFFANATGVPKGDFRRHQPGVTLGGPLPWFTKGAFFFVSYQATRDVNAASLASSVRSLTLPPIPLTRTPGSLGAIFGGQTGLFGGVAIAPDGSNINPVALNLLNAKNPDGSLVIPSPQTASSGVNYTAVLPGHYDEDQFNTNIEFNLGQADRLSVKFFFSNSNQDLPFAGATVPGFPAVRDFDNRNLAIAQTHIFSPQVINQFRAGFSRIASLSAAPSPLTAQAVGINRVNDPQERSLPHIQILGALNLETHQTTRMRRRTTISICPIPSRCREASTVFVSEPRYSITNSITVPTPRTERSSSSPFPIFCLAYRLGPRVPVAMALPCPTCTWHRPARQSRTANCVRPQPISSRWMTGGCSDTLTINLGFRLEANGQQREAQGELSNFFPEFYVPPPPGGFTNPTTSGFVLPDNYEGSAPEGFPRTNSTLVHDAVQLHPEPRIGVAWRPSSSHDVVVRAGYGMYANRVSFFGSSVDLAFNPPFQLSRNLVGAANAASSLQYPFPILPLPSSFPNFARLPGPPYTGDRTPILVVRTDPDFRDATIQHYGLETQYQLQSYLLSLAYAGSRGAHLAVSRSNNQPGLASPANPVNGLTTNSVANALERVPFLGVAPLVFGVESIGTSRYDSLQATVSKRLSEGFQFLAAYTLSKSVDTAQDSLGSAAFGIYGATVFGEQVFNDQNDLAAQRGPSDFDRRHRFVFSGTWELPRPASHQN